MYLDGAQNQDGQKVLVLYTDGGDTTSSLTFRGMIDLLKASDVTVYAVGYLEHQSSSGRRRAGRARAPGGDDRRRRLFSGGRALTS